MEAVHNLYMCLEWKVIDRVLATNSEDEKCIESEEQNVDEHLKTAGPASLSSTKLETTHLEVLHIWLVSHCGNYLGRVSR